MTKRIRRNADWLTIALDNAIGRPELPSATVAPSALLSPDWPAWQDASAHEQLGGTRQLSVEGAVPMRDYIVRAPQPGGHGQVSKADG